MCAGGSERKCNVNIKLSHSDQEPTTYLVQRLRQKPKSEFMAAASRAFGGGMIGMSGDAWKFCQKVFDLDYMGAAEYEFGVFPRAMTEIVQARADYTPWSFVIKGSEITPGWWRHNGMDALRRAEMKEAKDKKTKPPRMTPKHKAELAAKVGAPLADVEIYVVSHSAQERDLIQRLIKRIADHKINIKNGAGFDLDRDPGGYGSDIVGWFDLENRLLWFTDKVMFDAFVETFEIGKRDDT